jgi:hypothetical protein
MLLAQTKAICGYSLGNPDKIVDLGAKQIFVYKDMKAVLLNCQVSNVQ